MLTQISIKLALKHFPPYSLAAHPGRSIQPESGFVTDVCTVARLIARISDNADDDGAVVRSERRVLALVVDVVVDVVRFLLSFPRFPFFK